MRRRCLIVAILLVSAACIGASRGSGTGVTRASYVDRITTSASIVATDGAGSPQPVTCVRLSPGCSRAFYYSRPCPFPKVARVSTGGEITLDYGEIWRDGSMRSSEVLEIKNVCDRTIKLRCSVSGPIAQLFESVSISPQSLKPGKTALLCTVLEPQGAAAGEYTGTLRIFDTAGGVDIELPVTVLVLEESSCRESDVAEPTASSPSASSMMATPSTDSSSATTSVAPTESP